jgi:hypothetical protein
MRHKTTTTLYNYWNGLRGDRIAPRRFEVEPGCIGEILPDTFILERADSRTYPFRLAGTRICERFGFEFRGTNFVDGWSSDDQTILETQLATISQHGGAGLFTVEGRTPRNHVVSFELLILPLVHMQQTADRFLGSIAALESPEWLGSEPVGSKRLISSEIVWPDGRPHSFVATVDRQVPFLPHIRSGRIVRQDRRQFRVYDGGLTNSERDEI